MSDKPTWLRDLPPQDRGRMRRLYEGKLEELQDVDDHIGDVLDVLRRTGQLARTWIFVVSDNGYLLGEHRLFHKSQPYEEAAGIPFVVRGPGVEPRATDALVSQVDLMPTTLDIAGLDMRSSDTPTVPEGMAGFGIRLLDRFARDFRPVAATARRD